MKAARHGHVRAARHGQVHSRARRDGQLQGMLRVALILIALAVVLVVLVVVLRPSSQYLNAPEILRAQRLGILRVGVLTDAPGFSQNERGLEVDLAQALCKRIFPNLDPSATLELVPVNEYTALVRLGKGDVDIIIARQSGINPKNYSVSGTYYKEAVRLLCRPGEENVPLTDQKVGLIDGSGEKRAWEEYNRIHEAALSAVYHASYPDLCTALKTGKIDFVAVPASKAPLLTDWNISMHSVQFGAIEYTAVSSLESESFSLLLNIVINEAQISGTLQELITYHGIAQYQAR